MVNTREDAQRLVPYTHYAPRGTPQLRPGARQPVRWQPTTPSKANDTIVVFAMIETTQALDDLDDILSVEGLDAVYIGPSDLSLSLGCRPVLRRRRPARRAGDRAHSGARQGARRACRRAQRLARGRQGAGGDGLRPRDAELRRAHPHCGRAAIAGGDEVTRLAAGSRPPRRGAVACHRPWPAAGRAECVRVLPGMLCGLPAAHAARGWR